MCQEPLPFRLSKVWGPAHAEFHKKYQTVKINQRGFRSPYTLKRRKSRVQTITKVRPIHNPQSKSIASESPVAATATTTLLAEAAEARVDLDRRRVHAALLSAVAARELLESVPAELDDRRVVDRDHVHGRLVAVLQLPARAALGRAVDCTGEVN